MAQTLQPRIAGLNANFLAQSELPTLHPRLWEIRRWPGAGSGAAGVQFGGRRIAKDGRRRWRNLPQAAFLDLHSFAFLADFIDPHWFDAQLDPSEYPVRIDLDPARVIVEEVGTWQLSEADIKAVYMVVALLFCWGCCVFGSMNDEFYDSDEYRKAGGNGTGHWIYDMQEEEERAAREEMWSEDLIKEIEEKAEEALKS